jgi:hypothetical protein
MKRKYQLLQFFSFFDGAVVQDLKPRLLLLLFVNFGLELRYDAISEEGVRCEV